MGDLIWLLAGVALAVLVPGGIAWLLQGVMPKAHPIVTAVIAVVLTIVLVVLIAGMLVVRTLIGIGQAGTVSIDGEGAFAASAVINGVLQFMLVLVAGTPAALFAAFRRRARDLGR